MTSSSSPRLYLSNFRLLRGRCEAKQELYTGHRTLQVTSKGLRHLFGKDHREGNTIGRADSHKTFQIGEGHVMTGLSSSILHC